MKMEMFLLFFMVNFASERKENDAENLILVKIEEDEYTKVHKTSQYIGVYYSKERIASWQAGRWSKIENKTVYNGTYKDEETAAHASDTLARKLMKNGEQNHKLNFPDDDTEFYPEEKTSQYIGVSHRKERAAGWQASRHCKNEKKMLYNGSYKDEETAAHASDTLARKLMKNGKQNLKLNFPDDDTEVNAEEKTSQYVGVSYAKEKYKAARRSRNENKMVYNGTYKDEEIAAHASDTLARKLIKNGEQNHRLNFPDDDTEIYPEKKKTTSKYFGITYVNRDKNWQVTRWSKNLKKLLHNGYYKGEKTAAHASDTLARKLMEKGEQNHKLNFSDDSAEVYSDLQRNKRKRYDSKNLGHSENK